MVGTIQEYTLNMADGTAPNPLIVKQGDTNSRQARFKLTAFNKPWTIPFGAQIHINVRKQDGTYANATCTQEDEHTVLAPITEQMTAVPGTQLGELFFLGADGDIRSQTFPLVVWDTVTDLERLVSSDDYQALKDSLRQVVISTETAGIAAQYATEQGNAAKGAAQRAENAADSIQVAVDAAAQAETAKTAAETARTGAETAKADAETLKTQIESTVSTATQQVNTAGSTQVQAVTDKGDEKLSAITDYVESQKAAFVGYSKRETDSQYANAIIKTAMGAGRVDVADAWTAPVIDLQVAGRSEQVQTTGKNLFGGDALVEKLKVECSATVDRVKGTVTALAQNINNKIIFSDFEAGKEYTIIFYGRNTNVDTPATFVNMQVNYDNGSYGAMNFEKAGQDSYCILHTVSGKNATRLVGNWGTTGTILYYDKCGIFEGNIDLSAFEPYTGAAASPSPAYPQQIVSTGTVSTGAQLLMLNRTPDQVDSNVSSYKYIDGGLTCVFSAKNYAVRFKVPVQPNTIYTISTSDISTGGYLSLSDFLQTEKSGVNILVSKGQNVKTFNSGTATELTLSIYSANDSYLTVAAINIMLNSGSDAKPWEPYTGGKPAPSAEYPQEMIVRATGKNLLEDKLYNAGYSSGIANLRNFDSATLPYRPTGESSGVGKIAHCKKGVTYTFSVTNPNPNCGLAISEYTSIEAATNTQNKIGHVMITSNSRPVTYTAQSDGVLLCVVAGTWTDGKTTIHECTESELLQCEVGSTATPYEPYRTAAATITLTEPLRGKGEYQDRLTYRDGVWGIEGRSWEGYFDGSEDWYPYNNSSYAGFVLENVLPEKMHRRDHFSNQSVYSANISSKNSLWLGVNGSNGMYMASSCFYDGSLEDKGLANWKAHLASNPLVVSTYLATPTWTPLPDSTQQALNELTTYAGTTHLTITTGGTTPDVTLDYVQDTHKALDQCQEAAKTYVDNQLANIVAAMPTEVQAAIVDTQITKLLQEV